MSNVPYLPLHAVEIDPEVARCLPRRLAYYHLALPIARDDDTITVALAYLSSAEMQRLLRAVLNAPIVVVRSDPAQIKYHLDQLWLEAEAEDDVHVLTWASSQEAASRLSAAAAGIAPIMETAIRGVTSMDAETTPFDTMLNIVGEGYYSLVVTDEREKLQTLLRSCPAPMLLVRGAVSPLRKLLCVLRGTAPDTNTLQLIEPLARQPDASVTLLAAAEGIHFLSLMTTDTEKGRHVAACADQLTEMGIEGRVRLRQGAPEKVIAAEIAEGGYDLVAVAVEAYGDFVYRTLQAIPADDNTSILLVKP